MAENVLSLCNTNYVIKSGDKTPLTFNLQNNIDTTTDLKDQKATLYLYTQQGVHYQTESVVDQYNNVTFTIETPLQAQSYLIEIRTENHQIFPSDTLATLSVTESAIDLVVKSLETLTLEHATALIIDQLDIEALRGEPGAPGEKGEPGEPGAPGADGEKIIITETAYDAEGNTIITFSDNTTITVQRGLPGDGGGGTVEGITVLSSEFDAEGNTVVTFSDNSTITVQRGTSGKDGTNGEPGADGADGESVTITESKYDIEGNTEITFSDNTTIIVQRGEPGADGQPGQDGSPGEKGEPGADGQPGQDGTPGAPGADGENITITETAYDAEGNTEITFSDNTTITVQRGEPGADGQPGQDGSPGEKGEPGADGQPGQDGAPGEKGEPGAPGAPGADGRGILSIEDGDGDGIATITYTDQTTEELPLPVTEALGGGNAFDANFWLGGAMGHSGFSPIGMQIKLYTTKPELYEVDENYQGFLINLDFHNQTKQTTLEDYAWDGDIRNLPPVTPVRNSLEYFGVQLYEMTFNFNPKTETDPDTGESVQVKQAELGDIIEVTALSKMGRLNKYYMNINP